VHPCIPPTTLCWPLDGIWTFWTDFDRSPHRPFYCRSRKSVKSGKSGFFLEKLSVRFGKGVVFFGGERLLAHFLDFPSPPMFPYVALSDSRPEPPRSRPANKRWRCSRRVATAGNRCGNPAEYVRWRSRIAEVALQSPCCDRTEPLRKPRGESAAPLGWLCCAAVVAVWLVSPSRFSTHGAFLLVRFSPVQTSTKHAYHTRFA
jgi:hypothetical protein